MIISSDAEKVFDKIKHSFILKVLGISGIHDTYLNILKEIYNNPVANIRIQGEKLKAIRWKSGTWKKLLTLSLPIQYSAWSSSHSNKTVKGDQGD